MTPAEGQKAIKRLLGKTATWQSNPKALLADQRAEALAQVKVLSPLVQAAKEARDKRYRELLDGDAEYQRLKNHWKELNDQQDKLRGAGLCSYRVTAYTQAYGFYHVEAQGDNWAEVVRKLEERKAGAE